LAASVEIISGVAPLALLFLGLLIQATPLSLSGRYWTAILVCVVVLVAVAASSGFGWVLSRFAVVGYPLLFFRVIAVFALFGLMLDSSTGSDESEPIDPLRVYSMLSFLIAWSGLSAVLLLRSTRSTHELTG
jgi:hypothetical protein